MSMIGEFISIDEKELRPLIDDSKKLESFLYSDSEDYPPNHLHVDKAWHAIHFILTGRAWEGGDDPWALAILGGTEIGEDNGYGRPRYLTADQVKAVADALSTVSADIFRTRFDPVALHKAEIYPQIWERDEEENGLGYVLYYYEQLVSFYRDAANREDAVLLYIS